MSFSAAPASSAALVGTYGGLKTTTSTEPGRGVREVGVERVDGDAGGGGGRGGREGGGAVDVGREHVRRRRRRREQAAEVRDHRAAAGAHLDAHGGPHRAERRRVGGERVDEQERVVRRLVHAREVDVRGVRQLLGL